MHDVHVFLQPHHTPEIMRYMSACSRSVQLHDTPEAPWEVSAILNHGVDTYTHSPVHALPVKRNANVRSHRLGGLLGPSREVEHSALHRHALLLWAVNCSRLSLALCRDSMLSPMIVMLLRLLTSAEIQRRTDFFAPFVMVCYAPGPRKSMLYPNLRLHSPCHARVAQPMSCQGSMAHVGQGKTSVIRALHPFSERQKQQEARECSSRPFNTQCHAQYSTQTEQGV